jgi:hypothetical protein
LFFISSFSNSYFIKNHHQSMGAAPPLPWIHPTNHPKAAALQPLAVAVAEEPQETR